MSAEYAPFAIPKTQHEGRSQYQSWLSQAVPQGFALHMVHFNQAEILALNPPRCWVWMLSH